MNRFMKFLAKFTLAASIAAIALLIAAAALLIFAPELLLNILRYAAAALCLILAAVWIFKIIGGCLHR